MDNAEAVLEAKNERTASLYLDGLLETDAHRRLQDDRASAELDYQHARREVERLHLIVRLLGPKRARGRRDERKGDKREDRCPWLNLKTGRPTPTPTGHPPAPVVPEATGPLSPGEAIPRKSAAASKTQPA